MNTVDVKWADKNLPVGVTRQDVCVWMQDSDGQWSTSCGKQWEFISGDPKDNEQHFCHHCGGVLLAESFYDSASAGSDIGA